MMATKSIWQHYKLTWCWFFVFLWVLLVDFGWHSFHAPVNQYSNGLLVKVIWMICFSIFYTLVYEEAAKSWRSPTAPNGKGIKMSASDFRNSVRFGFIASVLIIAVIAWSAYVISVIYLYFLAGIRGEIPQDGLRDGVLVLEIIGSGLILELCGKDETDAGVR